jgi:hypothetical protein
VLLDVWDVVLHVLHFISFSSSPLENRQKNEGKKAGPHFVAVVAGNIKAAHMHTS